MAIVVELPNALRPYAVGSARVVIDEPIASVGDALAALGRRVPGVIDRVMTEQGVVREHVNVFVNEDDSRFLGGLSAAVPEGSVITILAAVSGG